MITKKPAIPLSVIGGFLGSGKTTLINNLLRETDGRRLTILVNDFGDINIDADLVAAHDGRTLQLSNGCICCTIGDSLSRSLMEIAAMPESPEHVVIEASGVADPGRIAQIGLAGGAYSLQAVCVLADAANLPTHAADRYMGDTVIHQLKRADFIALNKCDLVDEADRTQLYARLTDWGITCPVLETTQGQVPLSLLLEPRERESPENLEEHHHDSHAERLRSWSLSTDTPLNRTAFEAALEDIKGRALRAKGLLRFSDAPHHLEVLQLVGRRYELSPVREAEGEEASRLVVITAGDVELPASLRDFFPK
ncbi:CobW family GTP-binding protein [Fodinicurvata halophila]|uniref:CobW family GTP-binding protein n=1 Tax=Fodinicurvata halophila TaxID=1419723 RepID=A0ABV8UQ52_9PROT